MPEAAAMANNEYLLPPGITQARGRALIAGVVGLLLCGIGVIVSPGHFFRAYLMAYLFWLGVSVGCLALLMVQFLSGGDWGLVIRRPMEAATRTLPALVVLFIPILFGLHSLYPWTNPDVVQESSVLQQKQAYLNMPFFYARMVFYFAVWLLLAYLLNKWSRQQDQADDPAMPSLILRKLQILSGPGLLLYGLTVTFAGVDLVMSLEPEWFSTIFGMLIMAGQGLAALSVMIVLLVALSRQPPMASVLSPKHFHDLGKLLLTFVMLWAYFSFSQLLIIWEGDLPNEIPWYLRRLNGEFRNVGILLVIFHFALPFILLLSRDIKRHAKKLLAVAGLVIVMRFVDLFWLIAPEFTPGRLGFSWLYLVTPIAIGGIWLAVFLLQLEQRPLFALRDPYMEAMLANAEEAEA
jgi:hypothetical protein